ncbi:ATPase [Flavobacterium akiainvivens]|uniref:ATPase n=1 Tax=Flavobacterium akiainvivens TaxID=1202724 RepID=A0A0M8MIQ7_9FLAO|nr:DUF4301 family protein [Flavobacterium akiainvivens]KOS06627.1 ATPase [Flavobacterium akiainvivens]SFQ08764.1 protein of unknown function [Flavobacterium akiainvivens]
MEKSFTTQKPATINLTVYAQADSKPTAVLLNQEPFANEAHKFHFFFKAKDIDLVEKPKPSDIAIVIAPEEYKTANILTEKLKKQDNHVLRVITGYDDVFNKVSCIAQAMEKAFNMGFTIPDFVSIYTRGVSFENIEAQINIFKTGISKINLERPAAIGDGITVLSKEDAERNAAYFDGKKDNFKLKKFVPASGAATRMFKFLHDFLAEYNPEKETINGYINQKKDNSLQVFFLGLEKFPFYKSISEVSNKNIIYPSADNENVREDARNYSFVKTMMDTAYFDYANKPKGILPFHQYGDFAATPVYEHLRESVAYADSKGQTHVHFTISEDHLNGFLDAINEARTKVEAESGVKINFNFTYQHKETDTLAVDLENRPYRENGKLLFRPGGHGALIENLNRLDADVVFVKNIDNVRHTKMETLTLYKKALAGILVHLQEKVFNYLRQIEARSLTEEELSAIVNFAQTELSLDLSPDFEKFTIENKFLYLEENLNRPIRVCGMVKNEGEPGGGPFWVKGQRGRVSLQIVESSQVDTENKIQTHVFSQSTHFNPVDLVCGLKDYKGNKFNLTEFVDTNTGFIVQKNRMGKEVKSYELPGLWNGAMAGWMTVFVEVPLKTFNPVKTVNDLLKPGHQLPV